MAHPILMPKPGQMTEECVLVAWHKREGDKVEKGDVLFEIETDKSNMDVEAFENGVLLKRVVEEGQTVPVNAVCGYVGEPGEAVPDASAPVIEAAAPVAAALRPRPTRRVGRRPPAVAGCRRPPRPPRPSRAARATAACASVPGPAGSPPTPASTRAPSSAPGRRAASPSETSAPPWRPPRRRRPAASPAAGTRRYRSRVPRPRPRLRTPRTRRRAR